MKTNRIIIVLMALLWSVWGQAQDQLVLGSFNDIPGGLNILTDAYKQLGIRVVYEKLPAERSLISSNNGITDGEVIRVAGIQARYTNLIQVPVLVYRIELVAFSFEEAYPIKAWQDLKPYSIGIILGMKVAELRTEGMQVQAIPSHQKLISLVKRRRIQVGILPLYDLLETMVDQNIRGDLRWSPPLEIIPLYHYLHRNHSRLLPRITSVLKTMQANQQIERYIIDFEREVWEKAQSLGILD